MCGLAGYIGASPPSGPRVDACIAALRHRGPHGEGVFRSDLGGGRQVVLVHTRLAIIDLDARAGQPFHDRQHVIAFNGELYNYLELRRELEALGESFRTSGDTEVLVKALRRWGPDVLDRCEGMWAFALFDGERLLLSRDRFGEKPLFLHRGADGLTFASEPKAIMALLGRRLPPNRDQVRRYLVNGYRSLHKRPETFFQQLERLPPATTLDVGPEGNGPLRTYWRPAYRPVEAMTYQEAVAGARDALIRSVGLRLRADVPLAFCMSGGVDSNALIAIAKRVFDHDVHGFTIVNSDSRYEEQEMVDCAVRDLGIRHTGVPLEKTGFLDRLRRQVVGHDSPVTTITFHLHSRLIEHMAAGGYRIAVSGTAADELFSGYFDHQNAYLAAIRGDAALHAERLAEWRQRVLPLIRNPLLRDPDLFIHEPDGGRHLFGDCDSFGELLAPPWREPFAEERFCDDPLRNRMLNEVRHETVPVYLHEEDLNAMAFAVENRSPYLDRHLFDFCFQVPTRHLMGGGFAKKILRDAMRGIVSDPILDNRRKVGFNAPLHDLLDLDDAAVRDALLADGPIFSLLRRDGVEAMLSAGRAAEGAAKFLFSFISARLFLDEFH